MRKVGIVTAAIVAAVFVCLLLTLPPAPIRMNAALSPELMQRIVAGAYHIHSTRSDGAADKDAIAAAAQHAGLRFIILTDHGDGTRPADPPEYLHGVLCLDGVEISTSGGHYVALDMTPSPYPLGGEPAAVVEDVKRLGGLGIVAHPESPKPQLAWSDWNAPVDGIEWLSADSEWRDESRARLAKVLFDYLWRPAPALASLLDRPVAALSRWDALIQKRRIVGLAGVDAHGGIGRGLEEGGKRRPALGRIPSYESSFRTFSTHAILQRPFTGDAAADAKLLITAIRGGRVFTVIDAIAGPGGLTIDSDQSGRMWVDYAVGDGGELFMVRAGRDSLPLQAGPAGRYELPRDEMHGVVRFEVRLPAAPGTPPVPWIVSNPVYFEEPTVDTHAAVSTEAIPLPNNGRWHVEKDPDSSARIEASGSALTVDYTLASGSRRSQFVAAVADLQTGFPAFKGISFSISSSRPARVSVQLRYATGGGERWGKSVYVDAERRQSIVSVDQMIPADLQEGRAPDTSTARSLLFVVDLTNARPGDSNSIRIGEVNLVR